MGASNPWQAIMESLWSMPAAQAALFVLFLAVAVVGGNGVFALHYRRVGKPVLKSIFDPRSFPIADFNGREWLMLAGVFALSMILGVCAVHAG